MAGEVPYHKHGRLYSNSELAVLRAVYENKERADAKRRNDVRRRLLVFSDDWSGLLKSKLHEQFEPENAKELCKVLDTTNNVLKRVVNEISTIYHRPAVFKFVEGVDGEEFARILEDACWSIVAAENNRLVNVCNDSVVHVRPFEDRLRLEVYTPDNVRAWQDPMNPSEPGAIAYRVGFEGTPGLNEIWHFWSRGPYGPPHLIRDGSPKHLVLDAKDNDISKGHDVDGVNPYVDEMGRPILPFILYHNSWRRDSIWDCESGNDLLEITLLTGCLETYYNHLIRTDSIRQKYATGRLDTKGSQVGGTNSIMTFTPLADGTVTIGEFSSQADWTGLGNQLVRKLGNVLGNYGMSVSDFQLSGDVQSGFALRVRKEGLVEIRTRQLPLYQVYDRQLYRTVAAVWNYERTNQQSGIRGPALPAPSVAKPTIQYADLQTELTVEERRAEFELQSARVNVGLESWVDVYLREHPDKSEAEAEEAIRANKEKNAELMGSGGAEADPARAQAAAAGGAPSEPAKPGSALERILARREAMKRGANGDG